MAWHNHLTVEVSQLCERRAVEIRDQAQVEKRKVAKEKCQKTRAQAKRPKENSDHRLMTIATEVVPLSQSAPEKQVPSSPPPEEAQRFHGAVEVIIPRPSAHEEKAEEIAVSHETHVEKNAPLEQSAPDEKVDEEIEITEEVIPSPLRNGPEMPSKPSAE